MANLYVWSGATGTGSGADWANAKTNLTAAFVTEVAGDTVFVAHDHAESTGSAITLTSSGTPALPTKVICVNRAGSVPPVSADRRATATVTTTVGAITFGPSTGPAAVHYDGIIFNSVSTISFPHSNNMFRLDNCSLRLAAGATAINLFGINGGYCQWNNTTLSFAAVTQTVSVQGYLRWRNTPSALIGAAVPTVLFTPINVRAGDLELIGVDLSAAGAGKTIFGALSTTASSANRLIDCKLDPAVTQSAAPLTFGANEIDNVRSGASGNYSVFRHRRNGTLEPETGIVRSGGSSDGTTPLSWKVTTSANALYLMPFETPPIAVWNATTGTPITATVEGIWGRSSLPLDSECWLEVEYLADSSSRASFVHDATADLLATAAAQTASSATWANSPANAWNPFDMDDTALSNGNLTATNTSVFGAVRATCSSIGKNYFEITLVKTTGSETAAGIGTAGFNIAVAGTVNSTQATLVFRSGNIWVNNVSIGTSLGARANGDIIGIAVDYTAKLFWARVAPSGNWNNSGTANPATGIGGLNISALTGEFYPLLTTGAGTDAGTLNAGATAFSGAVPSGFTSGFPAPPPFKLSTTFTPAQAGWVYARVKCARPVSIFYIDPKVTLT